MRLYIGWGVAVRQGAYTLDIEPRVYITVAATKAEAEGWAMLQCIQTFPSEAGYTHHRVRMEEVAIEALTTLLATAGEPSP